MSMHTWEVPEIYQIQTQNQAKQSDWPKEIQKKCPIKVIQTATSVWLSHSLSSLLTCLFTCSVLFFLLINTCTTDTHILFSKLNKVMIFRTCSLHAHVHANTHTHIYIYIYAIICGPSFTMWGQENCPARSWGWKHDVYSRKTKKVFSLCPLFLWLWNCSPATSQGTSFLPPVRHTNVLF